MGNAAAAEELLPGSDELDELYRLDASETGPEETGPEEPEEDDEDEDDDKTGDGGGGGGGPFDPEDRPHP